MRWPGVFLCLVEEAAWRVIELDSSSSRQQQRFGVKQEQIEARVMKDVVAAGERAHTGFLGFASPASVKASCSSASADGPDERALGGDSRQGLGEHLPGRTRRSSAREMLLLRLLAGTGRRWSRDGF